MKKGVKEFYIADTYCVFIKEIQKDDSTFEYNSDCGKCWKEAKKLGIPCKHVLSYLFANSFVSRWNRLVNAFSKSIAMNEKEAEITLAKGLRRLDKSCMEFLNETRTSTENMIIEGNEKQGYRFIFQKNQKKLS
jgi:hypothetical protein